MSDDTDLTRLFAQAAIPPDDEAFVAGVTRRIWRYKAMRLVLPAAAAALLVLAIWASWPAAYAFSADAVSGILLIAMWLGDFFTSPNGMFAAAICVLTVALWGWLADWTASVSR